jgi:hypothetical protein
MVADDEQVRVPFCCLLQQNAARIALPQQRSTSTPTPGIHWSISERADFSASAKYARMSSGLIGGAKRSGVMSTYGALYACRTLMAPAPSTIRAAVSTARFDASEGSMPTSGRR